MTERGVWVAGGCMRLGEGQWVDVWWCVGESSGGMRDICACMGMGEGHWWRVIDSSKLML